MPPMTNKPRILQPSPRPSQMMAYTAPAAQPEAEEMVSFHHYLWVLRRAWWKIAIAVFACSALTLAACFIIKPVYEATARITVDNHQPESGLGQTGGNMGQSDVEQFVNTQMDLIQSDAVLRPVAMEYGLLPKDTSGKAVIPQGPVTLKKLTVAHPLNSLILSISYRSNNAQQAANVANAVAHSYIDHLTETEVRSSMSVSGFMEKQLDGLKDNMNKSAQALSTYEKQLGVIDPTSQTTVLAARILDLNTEYAQAENDRIQKQAAYKGVAGGNAAAIEVSPQAVQLEQLQTKVENAQQKMALTKTTYGPANENYKLAANDLAELTRQYNALKTDTGKRIGTEYDQAEAHEAMLRDALGQAKAESDKLNASSIEYQQLKRDADANTTLYNELFTKIKEAGINAGFDSNSVRIADEARPETHPVFPKKGMFTALAFFLSTMLSIAVALIADMLDKTVRDPEQARRALNIEVLGVLPEVHQLKPAGRQLLLENGSILEAAKKEQPLDWSRTEGAYIEAIRTMRSLVLLERSRGPLRSLLVTSALAGEGKSTCTAHMAIAHALQGRRTLLIDADLRRPSLHNHFALRNVTGLSEVILEDRELMDVRRQVPGIEDLDVITAGPQSQKAAHLIGSKIAAILAEAVKDYDLVVIDAPPMLGLAEPIQIACATDGVILIAQAGRTDQEAVAAVIGTLHRMEVNVLGLVLNKVRREMSYTYKHYGIYSQYDEQHALTAS